MESQQQDSTTQEQLRLRLERTPQHRQAEKAFLSKRPCPLKKGRVNLKTAGRRQSVRAILRTVQGASKNLSRGLGSKGEGVSACVAWPFQPRQTGNCMLCRARPCEGRSEQAWFIINETACGRVLRAACVLLFLWSEHLQLVIIKDKVGG